MKKLKMIPNQKLTFEEGCNKYLEYCRQRNTLVSILIKIPLKTHKKARFFTLLLFIAHIKYMRG